MQWTWLLMSIVGLYFLGHVLYACGLLWAALIWLALALTTALLFGAVVEVGRGE